MKYLLIILTMILVLNFIDNVKKEAELKEIQIIKEAENSNDPVLKQKAANMKAEIAREEQNKLQSQISEEQFQELTKNLGIEKNTFEMLIFAGLALIFILSACLIFNVLFKP